MRILHAVLCIGCSGLLGYGVARFRAVADKPGTLQLVGSPSGKSAMEVRKAPIAWDSILAHPQPGGKEALDLVEAMIDERMEIGEGSRGFYQEQIIKSLFARDPARALAFIDGIEDRDLAADFASLMLSFPPKNELPRIKAWMEKQEPVAFRSKVLSWMLRTWARADREGALAAIDALPEDADKSALRQELMRHVSERDHLATLEAFPIGDREKFIAGHATELSAAAPEETLAMLLGHPSSIERGEAISGLLRRWAARDPHRVAEALKQIADPFEKTMGFRDTAYGWSGVDSYQASNWVAGLPAGLGRDAAASGLAAELSGEQPDMALKWSASIADPEIRAPAMREVLSAWRAKDPQAAEAALKGSGLSKSERQALSIGNVSSEK